MTDPNKKPPEGDNTDKQLTAAEAAKRVRRTVTEVVDGKEGKTTRTKEVEVKASEVLSSRDYGTHVVVVTRDGQKLTGE
ncbi:hypothetical protein [Ottowia sp. VDI28]|uniref:hypothetical protein n=1 Tax=Ottowia sp. VDI28 TaxID=3133968 RepID=UPI003C2BBFA5